MVVEPAQHRPIPRSDRWNNGAFPSDHAYTRQTRDGDRSGSGTGLDYYKARYYDPATGSFISPDTIIPNPGVSIDLNRHAYVRGNPIRYNDPTGHEQCGYRSIGDGEQQWYCWSEADVAGGATYDEASALASDPQGRCQDYCRTYHPDQAEALEAANHRDLAIGKRLLDFGRSVVVVAGGTAAAGVCVAGAGVGTAACLLIFGIAGGAATSVAIECVNGCSGDDMTAALREGAVLGAPSGFVGRATAWALGLEGTSGLVKPFVGALLETGSIDAALSTVALPFLTTLEIRIISAAMRGMGLVTLQD